MINPIQIFIKICKPLAWGINAIANLLFRLFKVNTTREDNITFDDISAVMDAGAQAGVLQNKNIILLKMYLSLKNAQCRQV